MTLSKTGNIIESAEKKVEDAGINLVKYEIDSSKEVPEAMENLIGKIDALWLLPDSTVVTKKSFSLIKTQHSKTGFLYYAHQMFLLRQAPWQPYFQIIKTSEDKQQN